MTIYAVELARLNDGSIVPSEANMGIFYRTRKQALDFIRNVESDHERWTEEYKQLFCHVVTEVSVSNPIIGRTFDMDWQRVLIGIDDNLDLINATGCPRMEIARMAFANWLAKYVMGNCRTRDGAMAQLEGLVGYLRTEALSVLGKIKWEDEQ